MKKGQEKRRGLPHLEVAYLINQNEIKLESLSFEYKLLI